MFSATLDASDPPAPAADTGQRGGGRGGARRRRRAAPAARGAPRRQAAAAATARQPTRPRGVDVILLNLKTGRDQLLGSVGDIAFNKTGDLLAYTVDATVKDGNGLFVFDTRNGRITTLDNDARVYNRLTWNEDGTALAVLKGARRREDARARQRADRVSPTCRRGR